MRSLLVLLLVAFGVSGAATAQTAEFKCPAVGNPVSYTHLTLPTILRV